jgi:hypothetical protein
MAINYNPKIVTDGLVLCLDAGNPKSYPGTGTTWFNLSGANNTASMYGSTPLSNDAGGSFDFATASGAYSGDSSLGFTFTNNMIPTTGSFTISAWVKNMPALVGQVTILSNAGGGDGYRWGVGLNGVYVLIGPTYSEPMLAWNSTLSNSLWYFVTTIFDRAGTNSGGTPQWQSYLNGSYVTATNMQSNQTAFSNNAPGIVRNPCCNIYTGKLATLTIHNRALTAQEIQQNFNALRGRFGI